MSQSYEAIGLAILTGLVLVPILLTLLALMGWARARYVSGRTRPWVVRAAIAADLILVICAIDAWFVEPRALTVTRLEAASPKIPAGAGPVKIVQVSDIHFTRRSPFTDRILSTVAVEKPDLLFLTGDLHQLYKYDHAASAIFLRKLCLIAPTCLVPGFDDVNEESRATDGRARFVTESPAQFSIRGVHIRVSALGGKAEWGDRRRPPKPDELYIILNHTPDLIERAAVVNADWYFAGHTHGGQIRLPFWGAIITASETGKRYEYGRYRVGTTDAFVTRGIGLEPYPAPQVRFLCPPEIVTLTLHPE